MRLPEVAPTRAQATSELLEAAKSSGDLRSLLAPNVSPAPGGRYYHWDKLRRLSPPEGLSHRTWWARIKMARSSLLRELPLRDKQGLPFRYALADPVLEMLHAIDRDASGQLLSEQPIANPHLRDRYVQSSLIEEAITSSQLEGAATTREIAKEMIRAGREPIDRGERMILNNYRAIEFVREISKKPLTPDLVHRILKNVSSGTMPSGTRPPYLRSGGDGIAVYDESGKVLLHQPPHADEISSRMIAMCRFANETATDAFLHPVIKAIILHFWLAYDHPYIDGNGRTARALFYWSMLSQDFWLFEFVSISSILRKAPARYAMSFLYTETDENDLTYFILYQLSAITRAIDGLRKYLLRKAGEVHETEKFIRSSVQLNHRQIALISHALRHPGIRYTFESHKSSHRVAYQTARTDLLDLAARGILDRTRAGRAFSFAAPHDLEKRLRRLKI